MRTNNIYNTHEISRAGQQAALENEGSDLPPHFADLLKSASQQLKPAQNSHAEDEEVRAVIDGD